jgi:hypothetical protein
VVEESIKTLENLPQGADNEFNKTLFNIFTKSAQPS